MSDNVLILGAGFSKDAGIPVLSGFAQTMTVYDPVLFSSPTRLLMVLCLVVCSGCALSQTTKQYVRHADFSREPEAGSARVVVLREKAHSGFLLLSVTDDFTPIGDLDMGGYLAWDRPQGRGTLKIRFETLKLTDEMPVEFESGKSYYFRATYYSARIKSPVEIVRITEQEARQFMSKL